MLSLKTEAVVPLFSNYRAFFSQGDALCMFVRGEIEVSDYYGKLLNIVSSSLHAAVKKEENERNSSTAAASTTSTTTTIPPPPLIDIAVVQSLANDFVEEFFQEAYLNSVLKELNFKRKQVRLQDALSTLSFRGKVLAKEVAKEK